MMGSIQSCIKSYQLCFVVPFLYLMLFWPPDSEEKCITQLCPVLCKQRVVFEELSNVKENIDVLIMSRVSQPGACSRISALTVHICVYKQPFFVFS